MVGRGDLRAPPSHARRRIVKEGYDETAFEGYYLARCAGLGRNKAPTMSFNALRAASHGAAACAVDNMVRVWLKRYRIGPEVAVDEIYLCFFASLLVSWCRVSDEG